MTETQQRDDLAAALDGFWLTIAGEGRRMHGQIANPDEVADVLRATLSRIAAERRPDMPTEAMTETRIRWHHVDGTVVEWFGYVGTMTTTALFQILHPVAKPTDAVMGSRFDEWALCTTFPGAADVARYGGRDDSAPDRLKAEAEHWLAELVSSLGASFPEDEVDPFGPEAWLDHHPDCVCPDCQGAREEAATAAGEKE